MLDDKQLELLIDAADHEWIAAKYRVEMGVDRAMRDKCEEKALKLIRAARAVVASMRTPITAEALTAVGSWTHESTGLYRHDRVNVGDEFPTARMFVDFCDDDPPGVYIGEFRLPNVRTMHDLAQLVRLLGGDIVNS